jgi:uncharacterized protein YndB with AHSA1/START domain
MPINACKFILLILNRFKKNRKIMGLSFKVSAEIPASKEAIYNAWLDSEQHAKMTNTGEAIASTKVGDKFMAHNGYITGTNKELVPHSKIVQLWRTVEFKDDEEDSSIEVTLEDKNNNTLVTLAHTNLPPHGTQYESGWVTHYFEPMKEYFRG